jgi:hypothetical protein
MADDVEFSIDADSLSLDADGNLIIKNVPQDVIDKVRSRLKSGQRDVVERKADLRFVGTIS